MHPHQFVFSIFILFLCIMNIETSKANSGSCQTWNQFWWMPWTFFSFNFQVRDNWVFCFPGKVPIICPSLCNLPMQDKKAFPPVCTVVTLSPFCLSSGCRKRDDRDVLWLPSVPPLEKPSALQTAGLWRSLVTSPSRVLACWLVIAGLCLLLYGDRVFPFLSSSQILALWQSCSGGSGAGSFFFSPSEAAGCGPVESPSGVLFHPYPFSISAYLSEK